MIKFYLFAQFFELLNSVSRVTIGNYFWCYFKQLVLNLRPGPVDSMSSSASVKQRCVTKLKNIPS